MYNQLRIYTLIAQPIYIILISFNWINLIDLSQFSNNDLSILLLV